MNSYNRTRLKGRQNRRQSALTELNRLKIENQALKEQLASHQPAAATLDGLQLDHKEGLLGYFLDFSSTLAFINTTSGEYHYSNDAFAHYLGTTPDKVVGHNLFEFFPPELARTYLNMNQEVYKTRQVVRTIEPIQTDDGQTNYMVTSVFPLPVENGKEWVGGLTIDITDYVMMEKASKRTEERLHQMINQLPLYIFDINSRGIVTLLEGQGFANRPGGAPLMVGKPLEELFNNNPEVTTYFNQAMSGESVHTVLRTPHNSVFDIHCSPVFDENGTVKSVTGLALNITSQTKIWDRLRQSEQRFIKVFNSAPLPIVICRVADGTFMEANKAFEEMTGYDSQELASLTIFELLENFPVECYSPEGTKLDVAFFSIRNQEYAIRNKAHEQLFILISVEQVEFDGEMCFVATCLDITEQKKIAEAKRETEERLEAILYNSPVFIFAKDRQDRYLMFNRYCEQFSNKLAKDVLGKTTFDVYDWSEKKALSLIEQDRRVWETGQPQVFEDETVEGEHVYYDITTKFPMFNASGEIYAVGGISIDITDRMLAEKALAAEKEQLAVTLSSIADGVITTNTAGEILLINRVGQQITGWSQAEASGQPVENVFNLLDTRTHEPAAQPVRQVLESGRLPEVAAPSYLLLARNNSEHPIEVSTAPIFDGQGNISGSVLVFRDISEKLKLIEEHQKVARLESLGILAGGIAHDFNNLLTAIVGSISVARVYSTRPGMQQKLDQSLERAEKACMQSKELTQQLLTFARGGAPVKQKASLTELVQDSANFILQGTSIQRHYHLPTDLWLAEVDPGQLSQVIQNLVLNARDAMPDGGDLTIGAENLPADHPDLKGLAAPVEGPHIRLIIKDTGIGIPAENLTKIFDPYFTTKEAGNGLGLAICYSVIRNHQGLILVDSVPDQGTTFTIYLPALAAAPVAAPANQPGQLTNAPGQAKCRVLVMEDDPAIRALLADILDLLGYEVKISSEGEEALRLYAEAETEGKPFAVVIMDLTIPGGMGGREAVQLLKENYPEARAIVSSGYANDQALAEYQEIGFDALISKPYRVKDLAAILEKVLNS